MYGRVRRLSLAAALLAFMSGGMQAQDRQFDRQLDRQLLTAAQKAFDAGLAAAAQQNWAEAIGQFTAAQRLDPYDPRVLLDIALAHARAGHPVNAIAWFDAYLEAMPGADNAGAVRAEIARLKRDVQGTVSHLYAAAIAVVTANATKDRFPIYKYQQIAESQAKIGDYLGATETLRTGYDIEMKAQLARLQAPDEPFSINVDEMRLQHASGLAYADEVDDALDAARALSPAGRASVVAIVIRQLLQDRFEPADKVAAKLAKAETLAAQLTDQKAKAEAEKSISLRKLRIAVDESFARDAPDPALIEQYLAADPDARFATWRRLVQFDLEKKNTAAAVENLAKLESLPNVAVIVSDLKAALALTYVAAGNRTDAAATARALLAMAEKKDPVDSGQPAKLAIAKAVLGDYAAALQSAYRVGRSPYLVFHGSPDYVGYYRSGLGELYHQEFVIGTIAFCAAAAGKTDEALKIARDYAGQAEFQLAYTNVAYWYVLQNNFAKALDLVKSLPLNDTMAALGKAQLLGLVVKEAIARGDLAGAERAYADMPLPEHWKRSWQMGVQYRVEAALLLAKAHGDAKDAVGARRFVDEARQIIEAAQRDPALQAGVPDHLDDLLDRLALAQERMGDAAGAARTRAGKLAPPPKDLQAWIDFAHGGWLGSDQLFDPDAQVAEIIKKDQYAFSSIAQLAERFASLSRELAALEQQTGLTPVVFSGSAPDQAAWEVVGEHPDAPALRAFITQYPASALLGAAKARLAALEPPSGGQKPAAAAAAAPALTPRKPSPQAIHIDSLGHDVVFSSDGSRLIGGGDQMTWLDLANRSIVHKSDETKDQYRAVAISPDGKLVIAGNDQQKGTLDLFDAHTGALIRPISPGVSNGFYHQQSVAFAPDSRHVVTNFSSDSATSPYGVKLIDVTTGAVVRTFSAGNRVYGVAISPDARQVAGGGRQLIGIWDVESGRLVRTITGHTGMVESVAFSPDGRWLASASSDKSVKIWDAGTGALARTLSLPDEVESVAFSPDARFVVAAGSSQPLTVWDRATGDLVLALGAPTSHYGGIAFSPDGRSIAAAAYGSTDLWDVEAALGRMTAVARPAATPIPTTPAVATAPEQRQPGGDARSANAAPSAPAATPSGGADEAAWNLIKDTVDSQVLRRFIAQFPDSPRRAEAESRLQRLASLPPPATEPAPSPRRHDKGTSRSGGGAAKPARPPQAAVRRPGQCFMFNGRQVCE